MTNAQLYDNYEILIDKSSTAAFQSYEFDVIANIALRGYVESKWKDLITNIRYEADYSRIIKHNKEYHDILRYLHTPVEVTGARIVNFTHVSLDVMFITSIQSKMRLTCENKSTERWLYTRFVGEEESMKLEESYWDGINDVLPKYTITSTGTLAANQKQISIFTESTPVSIRVGYVRYPIMVDTTNNPNGMVDADDYVIDKVLKMTVSEGANIIEEYNKLSTIQNQNIKIQ